MPITSGPITNGPITWVPEVRRFDRWDLSTRVHGYDSDLVGESAGNMVHLPLVLEPGRIVELVGEPGMGLTRLGYLMLAEPSRHAPVVALDVRGWASPAAAWETGVDRRRLVIVRCGEPRLWLQVVAALCEGVRAMLAEVPVGVRDQDLRRLAGLIRARQVRVAFRPVEGCLPSGVAHLRMRGVSAVWKGVDRGHGKLAERRLVIEASGKGMAGMTRRIEVEDFGTNDVRVVSGMVPREIGRAG